MKKKQKVLAKQIFKGELWIVVPEDIVVLNIWRGKDLFKMTLPPKNKTQTIKVVNHQHK